MLKHFVRNIRSPFLYLNSHPTHPELTMSVVNDNVENMTPAKESTTSSYSQMTPDEIFEMVNGLQNQLVALQKSRDDLRLQLEGQASSTSKKGTGLNDPSKVNDPDEDDDKDDDDDDGDDEPDSDPEGPEARDMSFRVLIIQGDARHIFKMDTARRSVEELKFAINARLEIDWFHMELWPLGGEEPLDDDVFIDTHMLELGHEFQLSARYHVAYELVLIEDRVALPFPLSLVNIIEQFGERNTHALNMFIGDNPQHMLDCITCYLVEKTGIPFWSIKLEANNNMSVVEFSIRGQGGGKRGAQSEKKTKESKDGLEEMLQFDIKQPDVKAADIKEVQVALRLAKIDMKGWVGSLSKDKASDLYDLVTEQSKATSLRYLVKPYLVYVNEFKALQETGRGDSLFFFFFN